MAESETTPLPELRIEIPDDLHNKIEASKPEYLDRKGFVCLILDQAIDQGLTGVGRVSAYHVGAGNRNGVSHTLPLQFPPALEVTSSSPPTEAVQAVSSESLETSNTITVANRKKIRAKRAKGCDRFETFWRTYQGIPKNLKAAGQSKADALNMWNQLVPTEVSGDDLITAAQRPA